MGKDEVFLTILTGLKNCERYTFQMTIEITKVAATYMNPFDSNHRSAGIAHLFVKRIYNQMGLDTTNGSDRGLLRSHDLTLIVSHSCRNRERTSAGRS
jgi:hypothetical protein